MPALVREVVGNIDEISSRVRIAARQDALEIACGVRRQRIAHLNRGAEVLGTLGQHVGKVLPGVLRSGEEQRYWCIAALRDDARSKDAGAVFSFIVRRHRLTLLRGQIQDFGRRIVVMQHVSLRRLSNHLLVSWLDVFSGGLHQLPLRGRRQRDAHSFLQLLNAVKG